ncbi:EAL domain-containing protein [Bacillus salitolerans]|uniref:EAL domain-containing protein n=1 Tax=Bacillus salitolerans TaxID=1437434 RepID=A0ABW4LYB3_9BACI
MKYRGRIYTFSAVLIFGMYIFLGHYYLHELDSFIPFHEPIMLTIGLFISYVLGRNFDIKTYNHEKKLIEKQLELKKLNDQLYHVFHNVDAGIWIFDVQEEKIQVSSGTGKIYGVNPEAFSKNITLWKEVVHPEDVTIINEIEETLSAGQSSVFEYRIIRPNGEVRWVEARSTPTLDENMNVSIVYGVVFDITDKKETEKEIEYMAYHDMLTGLPNRYMYNQYLAKSLSRCIRNHRQLAIMLLDLDRFKFVNDTMGHEFGDVLLQQVSERLVKSVREGDLVARQGGDEFIILMEEVNETQVREIAEKILNSFSTPFTLNEEDFFTSPSIGISLFPADGQNINTLIKHADTAMYLAKKRGKNNYQFYIQEDQNILDRKTRIEQGLKKGLYNNEFYLQYQPKVNLETGEVYGAEALLRWQHPELGVISPVEFIPIAEETGMIIPLGKWILRNACKQNKSWQQSFGSRIEMAVNISSLQFEDSQFIETVKEILEESQLSPQYLGLEITESVMQNIDYSSCIIQELKNLGIKISIDDFGTGYSSLSVLNQLPIDVVKIDKSFVNEIMTNSNTASLVKTIIEMGDNFKFDLVAEGIENKQQAEFLIQNGCQFGQGYYYSKPLPANEFEKLYFKSSMSD